MEDSHPIPALAIGDGLTSPTPKTQMKSMTVARFKEEMGTSVQIFRSKNGKTFFRCGAEGGPVSEKAAELLANGQLERLQFLFLEGDENFEATWCLCPVPGELLSEI